MVLCNINHFLPRKLWPCDAFLFWLVKAWCSEWAVLHVHLLWWSNGKYIHIYIYIYATHVTPDTFIFITFLRHFRLQTISTPFIPISTTFVEKSFIYYETPTRVTHMSYMSLQRHMWHIFWDHLPKVPENSRPGSWNTVKKLNGRQPQNLKKICFTALLITLLHVCILFDSLDIFDMILLPITDIQIIWLHF